MKLHGTAVAIRSYDKMYRQICQLGWIRSLPMLLLLLQWCSLTRPALADCNVCSSATSVACISDTQFQICIGGLPTGAINSCPSGYVCTANTIFCQPNTTNAIKACNDCNQCNAERSFACTGARTYALCLGTNTISNLTGTCAPDYFCNANYPYICGKPTQGIAATCSILDDDTATTTTTTTTTTAATCTVIDPTAYCQLIRQKGRFPYGNKLASSCRQYIYCYLNHGIWYGALYTCVGRTYFNSTLRLCVRQIPSRCIALNVKNLRLFAYELP